MKRLRYAAIFSACVLATSACLAQSKQATERIKTHKDIAQLTSALNNWGADRNVSQQIEELGPKIASDLDYAGSGGVLVVARFEKVQTDAGIFRRLIADRVDYVGIGTSAVDAEIANIDKEQPVLRPNITSGSFLDTEKSTAYWFSKSKDGEITIREQPLSWLRRGVISELADRKRQSYDWQAARTEALTRLVDAMERKVGRDKLDATVTALLDSRRDALSKQAAINAELQREIERAQKAAEGQEALKAISFLTDYASFVNGLKLSPEAPASSPITRQQAEARLTEIQKAAEAQVEKLDKDLKASGLTTLELNAAIELKLRDQPVFPRGNLPPAKEPPIKTEVKDPG